MPTSIQALFRKRHRNEDDIGDEIHLELTHTHHAYHQPQQHTAQPRKTLPYSSPLSKRLRRSNPSGNQQAKQSYLNRNRSCTKPTTVNLRPCHICHRKPTKKTDLDSYADCEGCGERTCFICLRQCLGWCKSSTSGTKSDENHVDLVRGDDDNGYRHDNYRHGYHRHGYHRHGYHRHDYHPYGKQIDCDEDEDEDEDEDKQNDTPSERSFSMEDAPAAHQDQDAAQHRPKGRGTWGQGEGRGHRGRICSQCCVELGTQGEARCLGCLET